MINAGGVRSFYLNLYSNIRLKPNNEKEIEKPKKKSTRRKKNNYLDEKPKKILESSFSMMENPEPLFRCVTIRQKKLLSNILCFIKT